ncbi:MAG: hypothetical protein F6K31_27130 [Symploca sp. SIO2G7]|nr:hypothetical protein [Symploca sp. SIO2G7]
MSEDIAKTRVKFDAHPPIASESLVPLYFDINESAQAVYTLLAKNEELTESRIDRAAQAVLTDQWLKNSNVYNWLSNYIFEKKYPAVSKDFLNERRTVLIQHIVSRYADWMQKELAKLDKASHAKRLRHYRPELIQYISKDNKRLINIDKHALLVPITDLLEKWPGRIVFHDTYMRVYEWAAKDVLNTPQKNPDYYDELRQRWINKENLPTNEEIQSDEILYEHLIFLRTITHGNRLIEEGWLGLAMEVSTNVLSLHHFSNNPYSLDQLERIFGLVICKNPGIKDIPIPTGDGPTAITEGLNAAANNTWACNKYGELFYQTAPLPDGLVVKLTLTENTRRLNRRFRELAKQGTQ